MFATISGTVYAPVFGSTDRLGNAVKTFDNGTAVDGLLVSPSTTDDLEAQRVDGDSITLTVHFPKTWTNSLRGCEIELPGAWSGRYRVIGDPLPYIEQNTPSNWWLPVTVMRCDG